MAYVYRHIRLDKNEPFYIGIGKSDSDFKRAYSKKNRNVYWNNIVNLTEYRVEIMLHGLTWEEACEKEIEFISLYKKNTENGVLCNISDGGNGGFLSEYANEKRRRSLIGPKNGRAFKVSQYSLDGVFIKEWECAKYAIDFYNMDKSSISNCLKGRQKSAKGYIWKRN